MARIHYSVLFLVTPKEGNEKKERHIDYHCNADEMAGDYLGDKIDLYKESLTETYPSTDIKVVSHVVIPTLV